MTDTDFFVPAASAEKAEDFLLLYRNEINHKRYSKTRSDTMLANPLFYADWPLSNYEMGYELICQ